MMRWGLRTGAIVGTSLLVALPTVASSSEPTPAQQPALHVVVLDGPGTAGHRGSSRPAEQRQDLRSAQETVIAALGEDVEPIYRWTTALNGFAARLTPAQVLRLGSTPGVARVEKDRVHALAGLDATTATSAPRPEPGEGGQGTVIGVIDTGLDPDGPVFADTSTLGPLPGDFRASCPSTDGWSTDDCSPKVVSARHYVAGFGVDNLRSEAAVSAYDDNGHGTQMASLAAGNARISALADGRQLGRFSGAAPDARIAVYKACWSAPDPVDDGCSTADLVAAIDRATSDRVDVLNLSVTGSSQLDAVALALLGAAESDVLVSTAAGNRTREAGHLQPWTLTTGATTGPAHPGRLIGAGLELTGTMTAERRVGPARVVAGHRIPAPGRTRQDARLCLPGSLDAGGAADRIVLCERGGTGRIDKSAAVDLADGAGMVLANRRPGQSLGSDLHAVPTLHVTSRSADELRRAMRRGPVRAALEPAPGTGSPSRMTGWSAAGNPTAPVVKPDLVAAGVGILAATSPAGTGDRWVLASGTSVSTARVSGYAARVRAAHPDWPASRVRSALMGSSASVAGDPSSLRQGAGRPRIGRALSPGLVLDVPAADYRSALDRDRLDDLNLPSVLVPSRAAPTTVTREVTNTTGRHAYFSSSASGFSGLRVTVRPMALRIPPGATRTFRIEVTRTPGRSAADHDSGWVAWRGSTGTRLRMPVVIGRD